MTKFERNVKDTLNFSKRAVVNSNGVLHIIFPSVPGRVIHVGILRGNLIAYNSFNTVNRWKGKCNYKSLSIGDDCKLRGKKIGITDISADFIYFGADKISVADLLTLTDEAIK